MSYWLREQVPKWVDVYNNRFVLRQEYERKQLAEMPKLLDRARREGCKVSTALHLHESGGGATNTGDATIVCGVDGAPLHALGGGPWCNAAHAFFICQRALVVLATRHRRHANGEIRLLELPEGGVEVRDVLLWTWRYDAGDYEAEQVESVEGVSYPTDAVRAAVAKCYEYHCRRAMYVASGGAQGISGRRR
jgi:hypothetical protein